MNYCIAIHEGYEISIDKTKKNQRQINSYEKILEPWNLAKSQGSILGNKKKNNKKVKTHFSYALTQ